MLLIALLALSICRTALPQDAITVSGAVTTHADGAAVPGAVVSIVCADASATTDAAGRYTVQVPRSAERGGRISLRVDA